MRSLTQIVLTGTSCAAILLHSTIAASASGTAAAATATTAGTSTATLSGDDNRANGNRHAAVEPLPRYAESIGDDETTDLPISAPADLHAFLLQSDPAGGLSNLRGGQQQSHQQHDEQDGELTGEVEPVLVLHDIFDRPDQIPELAARKGEGSGSSRSKGTKGTKGSGSGSGSSAGKGSKSKDSVSRKGKGGTKSSKKSSPSKSKSTRTSARDKNNKISSSKSNQSDKSSNSKSMESSSSSKKKSIQKKETNSQRMCSTPAEKTCRNNCIDDKCDASDDASSPCAKRCRYKCCSDLKSDDRSKKNSEKKDDSDEERSCNTMKEKSCRSKCFYKKECRDDECKRECRRDCCVGGRIGSGSKTKKSKDKKKSGGKSTSKSDNKKKDAVTDGAESSGDEENGKGCDTDVEKQCRDTCFIESSCQEGDRECRKTCRQGCCDVELSIIDIINNAQEQGGSADDDGSLMSGDLPLSFRFTITTAERFTADDIMNGKDNRLKEDLEGGLKILVEDIVGEYFRGDGWKEESRKARRRKLLVRYQSDSPPTVEDVQDVGKYQIFALIMHQRVSLHLCYT